jgi:hypothetical protein
VSSLHISSLVVFSVVFNNTHTHHTSCSSCSSSSPVCFSLPLFFLLGASIHRPLRATAAAHSLPSLPIHCRFTVCSLFTAYSLPIHCLFTAYSLPIHCLFTAYSLPIHCLFTACSLLVHCLSTACPLLVHCLFTVDSLSIHCLFTAYSLSIHCLFTADSLPTNRLGSFITQIVADGDFCQVSAYRPALCTQIQSDAGQTVLMPLLVQLPPVVTEHVDVTFLFAFQTEVWKATDFAIVQLITGHRMDENDPLMTVLREMRVGDPMSAASLAVQKRLSECKEELPHFVGTRAAAGARNRMELDSLSGEAVRFPADDAGDPDIIPHLDKYVQAKDELFLKIWARVMLLQNQSLTLFNGSFGHIVSLAPVTVQWDNGTRTEVQPKTFSLDWGGRQATRTQIPLLLAWATTIHKSQGQGYARGSVDLDGCREHGQVYTALSRFESDKFLSVKNFDKCRPHMHEAVLEFYRGLEPV